MRRRTMAVALAGALLMGACASEADGGSAAPDAATTGGDLGVFAATPEYLGAVADAAEGRTFRIALDMTMAVAVEGERIEMGGAVMTGEVDGERSSMVIDMREMLDDVPGALPDGDLTMEMVDDSSGSLYVRAPFFATLAEEALDAGATESDLGPLADLAALGDSWGEVDLSDMSPTEVASTVGTQATDPKVFLDMLARGSDVEDLGTDTLDGVAVRGLGAVVRYEDMIEAQELDLDEVRESFGSSLPAGATDDVMDTIMDLELPMEVWVDDEDRVHRITMLLDMSSVFAEFPDGDGAEMSMDFSIDFTDYDDPSISVEVPTDAVDVTDAFLALEEAGGTGGSPLGST